MSNFPMPSVILFDNRPCTTSLAIAEYFGKPHKDVLESIRKIIAECPGDFNERNFSPVDYTDAKGEKRPMYHVFFDGFILLVMGYTGPKALKMKLAYIEAFNAMRAKIESQKGIDGTLPITPEMQKALQAIIRARLESYGMNAAQFRGWSSQLFIQMNHHFGLRSYKELPQAKLIEAIDFLMKLELPAKKIEAAPQSEKIEHPEEEDVIIDWDSYQFRKQYFDELAEIKRHVECLREKIHLFGRPGARSSVLSEEKQILYDNMNDCVNGAVTGLNIAFYNLRSACRIGSRTKFRKW